MHEKKTQKCQKTPRAETNFWFERAVKIFGAPKIGLIFLSAKPVGGFGLRL
jgi:hypothetical protein